MPVYCLSRVYETNTMKPKFTRKDVLIVLVVVVLLVALEYGLRNDIAQPTPSLQLTDEQYREMDMRLFNELRVRNVSWQGKTIAMRIRLIESMADQGFEVAALAMELLNVRRGDWDMPFDYLAYHRLKQLASEGDIAAICLQVMVAYHWERESKHVLEELIAKGAEAGHPTCLMYQGRLFEAAGDLKRAGEFFEKAAKAGNHFMQLWLVSSYSRGIKGYPLDIGKAKCWFEISKNPKFDTGESSYYRSLLSMWVKEAEEKGVTEDKNYTIYSWCEISK